MDIRLSPSGQLHWDLGASEAEGAGLGAVQERFEADWREGLFLLAAEKLRADTSPSLRYWQALAERYLTALCHIPEDAAEILTPSPAEFDWAELVLAAPPMPGGEYLSPQVLEEIWQSLDAWARGAVAAAGGVSHFLQQVAPKWRQVGRVCLHLAENKQDEARPFAFMVTYTAGLGAEGRPRHLPLRKALEEYAGTKNKAALLNLLSPVHQAAERCAWVKKLLDSGEIYQPMAWPPGRAYELLRSVPVLEESGLTVRLPNWWKKRARPQVKVTVGNESQGLLGLDALLDFDVEVALGDSKLSAKELKALLAGDDGLVLVKGQWVEVNPVKLREALEHWEHLRKQAVSGGISFVEGMRLLAGAPMDMKEEDLSEDQREWVHVTAGDALRGLLSGLRAPERLTAVADGNGFGAVLRPYQQHGLAWLDLVTGLGLGACLADDMGLGKTIQVLALLAARKRAGRQRTPSLLVVPASLLGNWKREAERFAPGLRLLFLHLSETDRAVLDKVAKAPGKVLAEVDLAVTTYAQLVRQPWLAQQQWDLVILDEAQAIKNPGTSQSKAVRKLSARARIAMTGTPVENRLSDLWSLFDFLNPGLLGSAATFKAFVKTLQKRSEHQFAPLRQLAGPYILRRLKTDRSIISDLPDKSEVRRYCLLSKKQVKLYEQAVRTLQNLLENAEGMARRGLVLQSLMRLKQICNHPSQLSGDGEYNPLESGKFQELARICEELAERQEKVLIFTQFREIIEPLAACLEPIFRRPGLLLHGGTGVKQRAGLVEAFQREDGPPFFILSLKAGGTGLTLTAAAHVVHFDRWWNPAVENQATDRAFRIGQKRNVLVHKFVTTGTIEERIDELIESKKKLSAEILEGEGEINLTELSDEALLDLVRLDLSRAVG